jgi:hypothetical protein
VRAAEGVWAAARETDNAPASRIARLATAAQTLATLRASGDRKWDDLARDVRTHARVLRLLGLRPADVAIDTRLSTAAKWALRRLSLAGVVQGIVAAVAAVVFWLPYRLIGFVAARMTATRDTISTYRILTGALVFPVWILIVTSAVIAQWGWASGIAVFIALPVLGIAGLACIERASWTFSTARRWLLMRGGDPRINALRQRQHELATRLDGALDMHSPSP